MVEDRQRTIADLEGAFPWVADPNQPYQVFPALAPDVREALRDSIKQHGVSQPVEVDEEGKILDGHNRFDLCMELGIPCPMKVVTHLRTPQEKRDYARSMNCSRREVTLEMKKDQARQMLTEDDTRSNYAIGRTVGLHHETVQALRTAMGLPPRSSSNQCDEPEEEEGPDLSFLEAEGWKSYHRLEALEHLKALGQEEKQIICTLLNSRPRPVKTCLTILETAAAMDDAERLKLRRHAQAGNDILIICRLSGTAPAPDPRLSSTMEAINSIGRIPEKSAHFNLAEARSHLSLYLQAVQEEQQQW